VHTLAIVFSYVLQAALIIATPGADVLLALATSLAHGRRAGLAAVAGMTSGYLVHAIIAAVGIAVLLAGSPASIRVIEFLGAAYLAWAGVSQIVHRNDPPPAQQALIEPFKRGFLTSLLNPKGVLFFLAFLPKFLPNHGSRNVAAFGLGLIFSALTIAIYGTYALIAGKLRDRLAKPATFALLRCICGVVFLGLAASSLRRALSH
jgi:threonine/homoserine/homoserine lactone efflux protein